MKPTDEQIETWVREYVANASKDPIEVGYYPIEDVIAGNIKQAALAAVKWVRDFPPMTHEELSTRAMEAADEATKDPAGLPQLARLEVLLEHVSDFSVLERRSMFLGVIAGYLNRLYKESARGDEEQNKILRTDFDRFLLVSFGFDVAMLKKADEELKMLSETLTPRERQEKDTWIRNVIKEYGWSHAKASKHFERIRAAKAIDKRTTHD